MIVLCDGMPRSGSTWAFNVSLALLRLGLPGNRTYGGYHEKPGALLKELTHAYEHAVIKAHFVDDVALELSRTKTIKCIYTHRHPYDAVASSMRMFNIPFEAALSMVEYSFTLLEFHKATGNACIVPYAAITSRARMAIEQVASYLGVAVPPEGIDRIASDTGLARVRDFSAQISDAGPGTIHSGGYVYDRDTLLHKNHVRDGRSGYGIEVLTREQIAVIRGRIGPDRMLLVAEAMVDPKIG